MADQDFEPIEEDEEEDEPIVRRKRPRTTAVKPEHENHRATVGARVDEVTQMKSIQLGLRQRQQRVNYADDEFNNEESDSDFVGGDEDEDDDDEAVTDKKAGRQRAKQPVRQRSKTAVARNGNAIASRSQRVQRPATSVSRSTGTNPFSPSYF